jgi:outer membrane immunogenic protein
MKYNIISGIAISALLIAAPLSVASAADMAVKAPPPPPAPVFSWTGFYLGVNAGYGWGNNNVNFVDADHFYSEAIRDGAIPASLRPDAHGFVGGAQAGYNFQSGPVVYGIETDIQYTNITGTASVGTAVSALFYPTILTTAQNKLNWFGTLRPRLGITVEPSFLIYATGGLAYGHVASSASTLITAGATCANNLYCSIGSASQTRAGWTAGAGAEYALSVHWSVKAEYLYFNLGRETYNMPSTDPLAAGAGMQGTTAFHENLVRGGLNYKF